MKQPQLILQIVLTKLCIFKFVPIVVEPVRPVKYSNTSTRLLIAKYSTNSGCYGEYIKLTNTRGIKLYHGGYNSYEDILNDSCLIEALKEADLLRQAWISGVTPKCYGVRIIKKEGRYRIGILMQDLGKTTLWGVDKPDSEKYLIIAELKKILEKTVGLIHRDLHSSNVMVWNNRYWAIDFGPMCITQATDKSEWD